MTTAAARNGFLYFRPGVYYFDFGFADNDHVWNMGDTTIVGGEPKGWNPDGGTPGGALGALGDKEGAACQTEKDSLSAEGIQWVLGGESQIDASGATVELCAQASAPESGDAADLGLQPADRQPPPRHSRAGFEPGRRRRHHWRRRGRRSADPGVPDRSAAAPAVVRAGHDPAHAGHRSRRPRSPSPTSVSARSPGVPYQQRDPAVSHRELAAATPPAEPGRPREPEVSRSPTGSAAARVAGPHAQLHDRRERRRSPSPTFDVTSCLNTPDEARRRLGGVRSHIARRRRRTTRDGAARRHGDRRRATPGPASGRSTAPIPTFRIGSGAISRIGARSTRPVGTLSASGPVQFRRGAIARSIDASGMPDGDKTRAFCLGYGPKCKQGPSRTLRYTASVGGGPPKLRRADPVL